MSSTRSRIQNFPIIGPANPLNANIVSGSMAADITSQTSQIGNLDQICYQVAWTSSDAVGTISVQGSVDNITFYDITFDPALAQPNSNNGGYLINLALVPFTYIRLKYTRSSGTGSLTASMSAKGN